MKIAVCGYGRHGKDTFARLLARYSGLRLDKSTSEYMAEQIFKTHPLGLQYDSVEACFNDRANHRPTWANFIWQYNRDNEHPKYPGVKGVCMYAEMMDDNDILVGIRDDRELDLCQKHGIVDLSIWVDASERLQIESKDSCRVTESQCQITVDNNDEDPELHLLKRKAMDIAALIQHNMTFGDYQ